MPTDLFIAKMRCAASFVLLDILISASRWPPPHLAAPQIADGGWSSEC